MGFQASIYSFRYSGSPTTPLSVSILVLLLFFFLISKAPQGVTVIFNSDYSVTYTGFAATYSWKYEPAESTGATSSSEISSASTTSSSGFSTSTTSITSSYSGYENSEQVDAANKIVSNTIITLGNEGTR